MKDDPMMKDAIAAARTVPNRYQRIVALVAVRSRASGEEREALIKEAFEQANSQYMMEAGVMVAYFLGHEFDDEDKSVIGTYVNANVVRRNYTNSLPCISVNLAV
jgi:hypothetical protein